MFERSRPVTFGLDHRFRCDFGRAPRAAYKSPWKNHLRALSVREYTAGNIDQQIDRLKLSLIDNYGIERGSDKASAFYSILTRIILLTYIDGGQEGYRCLVEKYDHETKRCTIGNGGYTSQNGTASNILS